ncbi:MAG TPA: hypothetical protein PLJ39_07305 [Spirochaetota bacterium]|nr:hypothetical protein [Spirochaetota bacterium]
MKLLSDIKKKQSVYIDQLQKDVLSYISFIDKTNIETILLSGSVARGDYYPGKYGAKIDLTFMKKRNSLVTPESILGENLEASIPYHCTKWNNQEFQIAFHDYIDLASFQVQDESKKYALLESSIIYDPNQVYSNDLISINKYAVVDHHLSKTNSLSYINYLLSDYKKNRWEQRNAFSQMHYNLNTAFQHWIKCIYYINGKYAPAEDRRLYYSYELQLLPANYSKTVAIFCKQDIESEIDYKRREEIFIKQLLPFIKHPSF